MLLEKGLAGRAGPVVIRLMLLSGFLLAGQSGAALAARPVNTVSTSAPFARSAAETPASTTAPAPSAPSVARNAADPDKKPFEDSGQVLMQADDLKYDRDTKIVTATGHVEVAYGLRVLTADHMTYDQNTGVVTADGHVALLDDTGDVAFGNHMVLRDELKEGVIDTLSVLMTDDSKMAGNRATRLDGNITVINKGVFSPCKICNVVDDKQPLWQIKAFRVIHNKAEQQIIYEDAYMEFLGVPVLYFPFFSQPDPTVKRRSGFLSPSFGGRPSSGRR